MIRIATRWEATKIWTFSTIGFFSATLTNTSYHELPKEQQHGHIMVRARVREDLERLLKLHWKLGLGDDAGELGSDGQPEILALPGHDYPYRIVIPHEDWVELASGLASDIDYSNFKSAVSKVLPGEEGRVRHDLYMKVWAVMHGAEDWLKQRVKTVQEGRVTGGRQDWFSYWTGPEGRLDEEKRADLPTARVGKRKRRE